MDIEYGDVRREVPPEDPSYIIIKQKHRDEHSGSAVEPISSHTDDTYETASLSAATSSSEVSDLTTPSSLQAHTEVKSAVPLTKYPEPPRWRFVGEAKKTAGYSSKEAGTHVIQEESSTNNYHDESINESGEIIPYQRIIKFLFSQDDKSTPSEGQGHDNNHDGSTNVSQENVNISSNNCSIDSSSSYAHIGEVLDDEISSKGDLCESNSISESNKKRWFLLLLIPILIAVAIVGVVLGSKNSIPSSNDEGVMVFATDSDGNGFMNATDEPSSLPSVYPSYDTNEQTVGLFGTPSYAWVDDTPDEPSNDYPWLQDGRAISLIPVGDLSSSPTTTQITPVPTPRPTRRHYSGTRLPVNPTPAEMEGLTTGNPTPPAGQDNSLSTTAKPTKRHFTDSAGSQTSNSPMSSNEEPVVITDIPSKQPTIQPSGSPISSSTTRPFWTL